MVATSTKELRGWYMYAFAAETYVICGEFHMLGHLIFTHLKSSQDEGGS